MLDEDGFLIITGRLSRFSKIGGEMVPHGRVEEALNEAIGAEEPAFAVTAVPEGRGGERLAVLHTVGEDQVDRALEKFRSMGLPNLFLPRRDHFIKVESLPLLGTGKLDLRALKKIAGEALAERSPEEGHVPTVAGA
jgi:acyl-[acyl-carrier-protein]-phospholipid O-acyltransferase/long-chain-fatty-acid--[acyl-carrier-protein] ligase